MVLFVFPALSSGQRLTWYERQILLPEPHTVSGRVLDEAGQPIPGAHIDHSDVKEQEQLFTDELGRFHVETRASALVVRKHGFDGQLIRINQAAPVRIVLHRGAPLPACKSACVGLKNGSGSFCFPPVAGVKISDQGSMGDSTMREFMVPTGDGPREGVVVRDAPDDPHYNKPVTLPYPASHESLWLDSPVYDLIVPLGYNDDPAEPGLGSAIYLTVK